MKVTSSVLAVLAFSSNVFADAEPGKARKGLCGYPGMTCAKTKRAAIAVSEALAAAEPGKARKTLCGYPGMTCHKARSPLSAIEDALATTTDVVFERDADAEAEAKVRARKGLCGYPGMTCHKARDAEAEPRRRRKARKTLCGYPGMTCHKMKRGLELVQEDDPEIFKEECFAEGGECHTVLAAANAFHEAVKREAEAEPRKARKGLCGYPGMTCARDAHAFAAADIAGEVDFDEAVKECNSENGDCTVVQRSLDALESTLARAVEEVYKL
ncbi:hypothetical protein Q7P37_002837 [Cladosporium fusiforme]